MTPSQRRWALWVALLAVSAYLAIFGDKGPDHPTGAVVAARASRTSLKTPAAPAASAKDSRAVAIEQTPVPLIPRSQLIRESAGSVPDLFAARSWTPPPPPPLPAPPAPPPIAPALPFIYAGKKLEGGRWEIYLTQGDMNFIVHAGETVGDLYRVERIEPPTITLVYTPLGQKQTLEIGE